MLINCIGLHPEDSHASRRDQSPEAGIHDLFVPPTTMMCARSLVFIAAFNISPTTTGAIPEGQTIRPARSGGQLRKRCHEPKIAFQDWGCCVDSRVEPCLGRPCRTLPATPISFNLPCQSPVPLKLNRGDHGSQEALSPRAAHLYWTAATSGSGRESRCSSKLLCLSPDCRAYRSSHRVDPGWPTHAGSVGTPVNP